MASTSSVVFHFDKEYAPKRILHVLKVLQSVEIPYVDSTSLEQMACEQSVDGNRFWGARKIAQQLGMVKITNESVHLTPLACGLLTKRDAVQYDLLHALFYTCIGYLGHPFVKEGPWAFIATLSLVARWYSAIDRGGEWFSYTGENRHLWTEAIKEGMQRLLERSAKDFFRHDATNWMDFVCQ